VLRVLLVQIATRQIRLLIQRLVIWPTVELALFISSILSCMPAEW
jgi:hypothetical protein